MYGTGSIHDVTKPSVAARSVSRLNPIVAYAAYVSTVRQSERAPNSDDKITSARDATVIQARDTIFSARAMPATGTTTKLGSSILPTKQTSTSASRRAS